MIRPSPHLLAAIGLAAGIAYVVATTAGPLSVVAHAADPDPAPAPKVVAGAGISIGGKDRWEPYKVVRLEAVGVPDTAGLLWEITPQAGAGDVDHATDDLGDRVIKWVAPPGRYLVDLTTVQTDGKKLSMSRVKRPITIGPPEPVPPTDPLAGELRTLFRADASGATAADMQALAALYRLMIAECPKAEYATAADLNGRYVAAAGQMLGEKLKTSVRPRAAREIAAVVPADPDAALTDATRAALAALYGRLAKCVEEAAK